MSVDISSAFFLTSPVGKILSKIKSSLLSFLLDCQNQLIYPGSFFEYPRGLLSSWSPKWIVQCTFHQKPPWPLFVKFIPFPTSPVFFEPVVSGRVVIDAVWATLCDKGMGWSQNPTALIISALFLVFPLMSTTLIECRGIKTTLYVWAHHYSLCLLQW